MSIIAFVLRCLVIFTLTLSLTLAVTATFTASQHLMHLFIQSVFAELAQSTQLARNQTQIKRKREIVGLQFPGRNRREEGSFIFLL